MSPRIVNWIYTAVVKPCYYMDWLCGGPLYTNNAYISGALRTTPNEAERDLEPP